MALAALGGVGDAAAGEWIEFTGFAFHIRRRLTQSEAAEVGPVIDVRGTSEARWRHDSVKRWLPTGWEIEA